MRQEIQRQLPIVLPAVNHEHSLELGVIKKIVVEHPEIAALVFVDLVKGLRDHQAGREGMMSAEQVFMSLLIKQMNGFSYDDLAFHLEDSRTYRAFCGFGIGDEIPSGSTIQRDIKKISPETHEAINRIILGIAKEEGIEKGRKARVDCTVVESNIHRPTDSTLLEDCVRVLSRLTEHAIGVFGIDICFVDHNRRAKRRVMEILNSKNDKARKGPYKDLLNITERSVDYASQAAQSLRAVTLLEVYGAKEAADELCDIIELAKKVISQTERRVLNGEKVLPEDKIVSIFEPHTDIIVKDRRETYFGHKIALSGGESGLLTDLVVLDGNPADSTLALDMATRQKEIYQRASLQIAYDGGFASKPNLGSIKELGVKDVSFSKKRGLKITDMVKSTYVYKKLRNFRAGIEGMISYLKRSFGLRRCNWKGLESFKSYAWSSVVTANLLLLARHLLA
jgi:transposase, IS5 family